MGSLKNLLMKAKFTTPSMRDIMLPFENVWGVCVDIYGEVVKIKSEGITGINACVCCWGTATLHNPSFCAWGAQKAHVYAFHLGVLTVRVDCLHLFDFTCNFDWGYSEKKEHAMVSK